MAWKIYKNRIRCLKCKDIIESKHVHDYVTCKCGACSVDGGHDYLKRVGDFLDIQDLSISKWVSTTDFDDSSDSFELANYFHADKSTEDSLAGWFASGEVSSWVALESAFPDNIKNPHHIPEYLFSTDEPKRTGTYLVCIENDSDKGTAPDDERTLTFNEVITSLSLYREKLLQDPVNYGKVVSKLIKCIFVDSDGYVNIKFFDDEGPLVIDKKGHIVKLT